MLRKIEKENFFRPYYLNKRLYSMHIFLDSIEKHRNILQGDNKKFLLISPSYWQKASKRE